MSEKSTIVRPALLKRLDAKDRPRYSTDRKPKLWGSELGGCLRKAMLRVQGYEPTIEFSLDAKEAMHNGVMFEDDTLQALRDVYGDKAVIDQLALGDNLWSCKADFVLWHGTKNVTIIEHKAVGDKWWNYNNGFPKPEHCLQIWLYGYLYKKKFNVQPRLVLFYRSWGNYAELELKEEKGLIRAVGEMNGDPYQKLIPLWADEIRQEAERLYANNELAEKLEDREGGCTFRGKPSCPMYYHCWKN
jgi:hypothetical protein